MSISKEELKEMLQEVIHEHRTITDEQHMKHHQYIEYKMARSAVWDTRWEKLQQSMIGGIGLGILGFLGWIGKLIIEHFQRGNTP